MMTTRRVAEVNDAFTDFALVTLGQIAAGLGLAREAWSPLDSPLQRADRQALYVVFIDLNGEASAWPDWEQNTAPQPLAAALEEAADLRRHGWSVKLEPES